MLMSRSLRILMIVIDLAACRASLFTLGRLANPFSLAQFQVISYRCSGVQR